MDFPISRAELFSVAGIARTKSFEMEKAGQLRAISHFAGKTWFLLSDVMFCVAGLHGLESPSAACIQARTVEVMQARSGAKGQMKA